MTYEDAAERLASFPERDVGRGATADEVSEAERLLGATLPSSYRTFLVDFGWGGVGDWEVFGLGEDVPPYLDLVRVTLSERTEMVPPLPERLVPFHNDGGGNLYCLNTGRSAGTECPVVFWDHEGEVGQEPPVLAESFASWLSDRLDHATS